MGWRRRLSGTPDLARCPTEPRAGPQGGRAAARGRGRRAPFNAIARRAGVGIGTPVSPLPEARGARGGDLRGAGGRPRRGRRDCRSRNRTPGPRRPFPGGDARAPERRPRHQGDHGAHPARRRPSGRESRAHAPPPRAATRARARAGRPPTRFSCPGPGAAAVVVRPADRRDRRDRAERVATPPPLAARRPPPGLGDRQTEPPLDDEQLSAAMRRLREQRLQRQTAPARRREGRGSTITAPTPTPTVPQASRRSVSGWSSRALMLVLLLAVARPDDRLDRAADDRRRARRPRAPLVGRHRLPARVDGRRRRCTASSATSTAARSCSRRAIVIFLIGSALCGLAQDMTELIAFRAVQGLGGGGLMVSDAWR